MILFLMAQFYTQPEQHVFYDLKGQGGPLVGGRVHAYEHGTLKYLPTYMDADRRTVNVNPVVLDHRGAAQMYLIPDKKYRFVVRYPSGRIAWAVSCIIAYSENSSFRQSWSIGNCK